MLLIFLWHLLWWIRNNSVEDNEVAISTINFDELRNMWLQGPFYISQHLGKNFTSCSFYLDLVQKMLWSDLGPNWCFWSYNTLVELWSFPRAYKLLALGHSKRLISTPANYGLKYDKLPCFSLPVSARWLTMTQLTHAVGSSSRL